MTRTVTLNPSLVILGFPLVIVTPSHVIPNLSSVILNGVKDLRAGSVKSLMLCLRVVFLLANLRTVLLGEINIAEGTVKIHAGAQHMGIGDKNLLTFRTGNFYSLTHNSS
jgi:hypothetical protein